DQKPLKVLDRLLSRRANARLDPSGEVSFPGGAIITVTTPVERRGGRTYRSATRLNDPDPPGRYGAPIPFGQNEFIELLSRFPNAPVAPELCIDHDTVKELPISAGIWCPCRDPEYKVWPSSVRQLFLEGQHSRKTEIVAG